MVSGGAQGDRLDTDRVAGLVGQRVVVRYRLPEPDPATGATLTDAVGELSADEASVTVATRRGDVQIERARIVALKGIPPRPVRPGPPHRRLSVLDLERVKAPMWPAREREPLGDWLLRAHGGLTNRANSALVAGDPGLPVSHAMDHVHGWYAARDLVPNLAITLPPGAPVSDSPVGAAAVANGWREKVRSRCLTNSVARAYEAWQSAAPLGDLRGEVTEELSPAWLASFLDHRGGDTDDARALLTSSPTQLFAHVWDGEVLVGRARMAAQDSWVSLAAVHVAPSHRRRGIGHRMMADLLAAAGPLGAESVCLEYEPDNEAAAALYATAGFVDHHDIVNLIR